MKMPSPPALAMVLPWITAAWLTAPGNPYFAPDDFCWAQCWYDEDVYSPAGMPDTVYLIGANGNLPKDRWSAAGFADTDPVATNATKEGQQKNRRCDIIVVPSVEEMIDLKSLASR